MKGQTHVALILFHSVKYLYSHIVKWKIWAFSRTFGHPLIIWTSDKSSDVIDKDDETKNMKTSLRVDLLCKKERQDKHLC